jgi:hypothetical protein
MQGYSKGSEKPFITANNNGYLQASMQGYSKVRVKSFMTVHNNG